MRSLVRGYVLPRGKVLQCGVPQYLSRSGAGLRVWKLKQSESLILSVCRILLCVNISYVSRAVLSGKRPKSHNPVDPWNLESTTASTRLATYSKPHVSDCLCTHTHTHNTHRKKRKEKHQNDGFNRRCSGRGPCSVASPAGGQVSNSCLADTISTYAAVDGERARCPRLAVRKLDRLITFRLSCCTNWLNPRPATQGSASWSSQSTQTLRTSIGTSKHPSRRVLRLRSTIHTPHEEPQANPRPTPSSQTWTTTTRVTRSHPYPPWAPTRQRPTIIIPPTSNSSHTPQPATHTTSSMNLIPRTQMTRDPFRK